MSCLCECSSFRQTAWTWGKVTVTNLHLPDLPVSVNNLEITECVDRYFCVPGRMTCWTWRPCFRKILGWGARSFSLKNSRALRSPYLKSPGTFMWMDTFPNLTEKNRRKMSCQLQKLERAWREAELVQQRWVRLFQWLHTDICHEQNRLLDDIWQFVALKTVAGFHQKKTCFTGSYTDRKSLVLCSSVKHTTHIVNFMYVGFFQHRTHFNKFHIPCDSSYTHK